MPGAVLLQNYLSERRGPGCSAAAVVEKPPAHHLHLGAVGGHDVQVRGALGADDEPGGNRRAREQLGDQAPEQVDHGESLPGHARAVEWESLMRGLCACVSHHQLGVLPRGAMHGTTHRVGDVTQRLNHAGNRDSSVFEQQAA